MRVVDEKRHIDYRLHLLGLRVTETECQLIARGNGNWEAIGPKWPLPIEFPESVRTASTDTLRLTAWQYDKENPGSDLRMVLARTKTFEAALNDGREL